MRRWIGIPFALVLMTVVQPSAWANSELHLGGRLFFPLWDVSTSERLTFIILTRTSLHDNQQIIKVGSRDPLWVVNGSGSCLPRGVNGSETNVNRTDLGGTGSNPVFVDDVHLEYYGRTCINADEVIHMSCGDVDLLLLSSFDNKNTKPRSAFSLVAEDRRGALDVHFTTNSPPGGFPGVQERKLENSLMGHAVITDLAQGWTASYPAAPAKAVPCTLCDDIDGGTTVGYEPYPTELYLPFALADDFPSKGGDLQNRLALWGPALMPGGSLGSTSISVQFRWSDGRERVFFGSRFAHSSNLTLSALDSRFDVANFVCGHTSDPQTAENDGFPRSRRSGSGDGAFGCSVAGGSPDPDHKSDNFESTGESGDVGHTIQPSTPIGHWRFRLQRDNQVPSGLEGLVTGDHSGRGLVGVVLTSPEVNRLDKGGNPLGVGYATRLWHEDPCEKAQSGQTIGPPHERDQHLMGSGDAVALFNVFTLAGQETVCNLGIER